MHAVYTSDNAICHGGHSYASSTMKDTLCGLIHAFATSHYVANNTTEQSQLLLRQIMFFFSEELEHRLRDVDGSFKFLHSLIIYQQYLLILHV